MREENTNQQQAEAPRVSRVREYMTAKFPDRQFADEDDYENTLYDYLAESDKKIAGHEAANKTIMEVVQAYPEFAQIIEDVANGVPVQVAIARQFDPSELAVPEGEPDYDAYKKAATERSQRLADMKARTEARDKNIAHVLNMTVEEAHAFFKPVPAIARRLQTLLDVGLGYIRLGQPAPTLSGGESQRVKLATELQRRSTGKTVYILDEPTTGLHFEDVRKLLLVLQGLVDKGNTVIVIEHNLDVVKSADWIIDLGPEGGDGGGTIVTEGTPEQVAQCEQSWTGKFLRDML